MAQLLDGITDDAAAVRSEPKVQRAWAAAIVDAERIGIAWSLAFTLRSEAFVPDLVEGGDLDWRYRRPDLVADYDQTRHPVTAMLTDIEAGAEPAVVTADQVVQRVYRRTS